MNEIDFIRRVSLFSEVKHHDLIEIAKAAQHHQFKAGDLIFREGDPNTGLFIVVSGSLAVVKDFKGKDERRMGVLGPFSYFGEMALIDDMPRSASVMAQQDAHLISLKKKDLVDQIEKTPAIAMELLKMLSQRIRVSETYITRTLGSMLPICASCKKIREESGKWKAIEAYIRENSGTEFSHGLCPECAKKLYPEFYREGEQTKGLA